jgi:ubiquinone/menaquinone biosynthesis C-methylase UbiE
VVNFLEATGRLKGKVLDYGCGPGYLLSHFLERKNLECYGVDISQESIGKIRARFASYSNLKEAIVLNNHLTSYPDNYFDVITLVETLEHLSRSLIPNVLNELKRIIKLGGIILITTPFSEILEENMVYCPFCNSVFHKWQHLESYTIESMVSLLNSNSMKVISCQNMDFMQFQDSIFDVPFLKMSFETFILGFDYLKRTLKDMLRPRNIPISRAMELKMGLGSGKHLCVLATKEEYPGAPKLER